MSSLVNKLYALCRRKISHMIGSGYCILLTTLLNSCKSLTQQTLPSFLGVINVSEAHSLAPCSDKTPISTKWISSFLKAFRCITGGVVHPYVGQNVTLHNPSLWLFFYHFLHTMSSWCHKSIHNNTNNQQTPPPWWWSRLPLQRCGFNESTPSEWRAALHMFVPRPLSKGFGRINKLM